MKVNYADGQSLVRKRPAALELGVVFGAAFIIGLSAQVRIRVPLSPVPVTAQTLAVLSLGMLLGARRAPLAVLLYLVGGALGIPLFAGGALFGPSGGYLLGFVAASFVTGVLADRGWGRRVGSALFALLLGNAIIYAFGLPWLAAFVGTQAVLPLGLFPFIPGDLLKVLCASSLLSLNQRFDHIGWPFGKL